VVRFAGAIYLAWLAVVTWRSGAETDAAAAVRRASAASMYRQGLVTSLLNPKLAVFQLALFPQFIDPARGSVLLQGLVLAATQLVIVIAGDSACVFAATGARRWFARRPGWSRWSKRALASVFAGLAARLAIQSQS
jgi:threonine/homoserine/homoserine lactone efflux protein